AGVDPAVVKAVEAARAEVRQSPRSAAAWGRLGMVLAANNFAAQALDCLARAERLQPDDPRWPHYQALLLAGGDPPAAVPDWQRAVVRGDDARRAAPQLRLAELLLGLGRTDEAEAGFHDVLRRDPYHPLARLGLARCACARGAFADALPHLEHAAVSPLTKKA